MGGGHFFTFCLNSVMLVCLATLFPYPSWISVFQKVLQTIRRRGLHSWPGYSAGLIRRQATNLKLETFVSKTRDITATRR